MRRPPQQCQAYHHLELVFGFSFDFDWHWGYHILPKLDHNLDLVLVLAHALVPVHGQHPIHDVVYLKQQRRYGYRAVMLETMAAVPGMVGGMLLHCKSLRRFEHSGVQGVFFNAYFLAYLISPKLAHRMVGYLEEEAIHSYTEFLKELDKGNIENVPAPAIAIDYWQLPPDSTLRDVVMVVRADKAHHRDVNHFASEIIFSFLAYASPQ
ncbi:hypothetical protein HYC85_027182 [Camellia sinensis]|uniref:Ubiquinol oxidase n=1 Tax=Camellia sinensis TaxID=4442 RepID=A0A7J7G5Q1_CAMSI|nr:hypothetical protein HYC85_027182 [Camellia sinensis]